MGGIYVCLVEAGFDAAYLDQCTYMDLDLFMGRLEKRNEKRKK